MVLAILNGKKTQTRRVVPIDWVQSSKEPLLTHGVGGIWHFWNSGEHQSKYQIDDILYIRESFRPFTNITLCTEDVGIVYKADGEARVWSASIEDAYSAFAHVWKPSIFLPKKFSRIFVKVVDIKIERLNSISEEDAVAEGVKRYGIGGYEDYTNSEYYTTSARSSFLGLWESIHKKDKFSSDSNPWVFVYRFEKVEIKTLPFSIVERGM
jgi:hypothetical protein